MSVQKDRIPQRVPWSTQAVVEEASVEEVEAGAAVEGDSFLLSEGEEGGEQAART